MKANGHTNGHGSNPGHLRFPLIPFGEISLDTKRRYVVKNLIPREGLVVVWGPPKCGKSFFVSDIALHVALGWPYRSKRVDGGTVVYVTCEGQAGFPARIEAFRQERLTEETSPPPFHLLPTRLDLINEVDLLIHDITAQLGVQQCTMIVLDTLNRSLSGSESKDEDMSAYVQCCDKLKETFHAAVVIIHHCGISGDRPRGHTSLSGASDAQIAVKKQDDGNIIASIEYMKDGPDGEEFASRLHVVEVGFDEDEDPITSCVIEPVDEYHKQATKPHKRVSLSAGAKIAFANLQKAIGAAGQPAPSSNHIPNFATVVDVDMWRRYHYAGTASDKTPEARKKDFQRAREQLQGANLVGIHADQCWII